MTRFLVTTPGASATRWLSFALAAHPQVYVTHGKFALDSVTVHGLENEHRQGDHGSLTRGNELREFYAARTLDEIFAAYRETAPDAAAHGNVHTFTIGELLEREANGESLDGVRIVNLVRHPISFIESHTALVLSAEQQPDLRTHYRQVFRTAVEFCPEALLVETDRPVEAMAFVVSCYGARQAALDLACDRWPSVRMEDLTTDPPALARFCRNMTGLEYKASVLEQLVRGGPINSHRAKPRRAEPSAAWREWPAWRRDLFALFVTPQLFDLWRTAGYDVRADVSHLRETGIAGSEPAVTCLGDFSDELGLRRERPEAVLVEEDFCGFHLFEAGPQGIGLATSLGEIDWRQIDKRTLTAWEREGICILAPTVEIIREALLARPPVLADSHAGFNIVQWRGRFVAIAQKLGPVDLTLLTAEQTESFAAQGTMLSGNTISEVIIRVDERDFRHNVPANETTGPIEIPQSPRLVADHKGYNIIAWRGQFVAVAQCIGPVDLASLTDGHIRQFEAARQLLWGQTLDEVRSRVDDIPVAPPESLLRSLRGRKRDADGTPRLLETVNGYNIVGWKGRFAAVAQSLGPVDLTALPDVDSQRLESQGLLIWEQSLSRIRRRVDGTLSGPPEPWMHRLHRHATSIARVPRRAASVGRRAYRRLVRPMKPPAESSPSENSENL